MNQAKNLPVFVPDATLLLDAPSSSNVIFRTVSSIVSSDRNDQIWTIVVKLTFEDEQLRVKELKNVKIKRTFNFKKDFG